MTFKFEKHGVASHLGRLICIAAIVLSLSSSAIAAPLPFFVEHIELLTTGRTGTPVKLNKVGVITTKATFKPPVEILVEAKTESTNLRLGYAADQVIFNWELDGTQLRIDGGPANGKHKPGEGMVPRNQFVKVRWIVTATKQSIFVDDQLRFEHSGDYSKIDKPISIFGSEVTVRSIKVR